MLEVRGGICQQKTQTFYRTVYRTQSQSTYGASHWPLVSCSLWPALPLMECTHILRCGVWVSILNFSLEESTTGLQLTTLKPTSNCLGFFIHKCTRVWCNHGWHTLTHQPSFYSHIMCHFVFSLNLPLVSVWHSKAKAIFRFFFFFFVCRILLWCILLFGNCESFWSGEHKNVLS